MKLKYIPYILWIGWSVTGFAFTNKNTFATKFTKTQQLALFAKSWGLMKYYHPGTGQINWDSVLVVYLPKVQQVASKEKFNQLLTSFLSTISNTPYAANNQSCPSSNTETLANFKWINTSHLSSKNQTLLRSFLSSKKGWHKNKYVSDSTRTRALGYARFYEDPMKNAELNKPEVRLLGLFRYWNIIEYFFPYKNQTDAPWDQVLVKYIPQFVAAKDAYAYYILLLKLSTEINDGHASTPYHPQFKKAFFGKYTVPFKVKIVQNHLVVCKIESDSLAKIARIRVGDIITHIDDVPIQEKISYLGQFLPAPNQAFHYRQIGRYILQGNTQKLHLQIQRGNIKQPRSISRYPFAVLRKHRDKLNIRPWKIISQNIGYAHMGELALKDLPAFFKGINNTQGLILDFRHYPNWEVFFQFLSHFYPQKKSFALLKSQCLSRPGTFYWHPQAANDLSNIRPVKNLYRKKVLLLVDENTLSFGEYFVMALQNLKTVQVVGSQTAGEDGNQVGIEMPGGIRMFMSSLGIYYPNGDQSQRVGVKINHLVPNTLNEIITGKDIKLEFALEFLKKN